MFHTFQQDWLADEIWPHVMALTAMKPFNTLVNDIAKNDVAWRAWYQ